MPLDLQGLLHNKPFLYGAAGVAAVGGYVLYQRSKTGATGSAGGSTATGVSGSVGSPAGIDTTGTDVANWLGQYDQNVQQEFQQLTDALTALQNAPVDTGGTGAPPASQPPYLPPRARPGGGMKATPQRPIQVTVTRYTSRNPAWSSTLSGIAGHYHTSVAALMRLNPTIRNPNLIRTGQKIRVT